MFAGIITRSNYRSPSDYATEKTLLRAISPYNQADSTGGWESHKALIVHALTWNTSASKYETTPYQCPHSKLVIVSWLRLDNRSELCAALKLNNQTDLTDPMLVIEAYRAWSEGCANRLEGDFSFVIYNPCENRCFAARDSLGVKPFYYYLDKNLFIFSSTAAIFPHLAHFKLKPNRAWVSRFLIGSSASITETGFEKVQKLPPAHYFIVEVNADQQQRYFEFRDDAPSVYERSEHWVKSYRKYLETGVIDRLNSDYLIASESSGGLDSSTVSALAALNLPHDKDHFHLFGYAIWKDEPEYILTTSQFHGIANNHIFTRMNPGESPRLLFEREMLVLGYPCEHDLASGLNMFYHLCAQFNARTLLSGFGGDEAVSNSGGLLNVELVDAKRYKALYRDQIGNPMTRLIRTIRLIRRERRHYSNYRSHAEKSVRNHIQKIQLRPNVVNKYHILNGFSQPDRDYLTVNSFILGNYLTSPHLPTRLENCTLMAAAYRVDYRWPLLDRRLIQQYLSTPSIEKYSARATRYLHRRAVQDFLPEKVAWKRTKELGGEPKIYDGEFSKQVRMHEEITKRQDFHEVLDDLLLPDLQELAGLKETTYPTIHLDAAWRVNAWLHRNW